jgi:hypothetical protein
MASVPRSPVRTRTMASTGVTHTFPSPILPVRAAFPDLPQGSFDVVERERLNDRRDQLHSWSASLVSPLL